MGKTDQKSPHFNFGTGNGQGASEKWIAMALLEDFQRVNREHPCPICEKADWCLVSKDDPHSPSKVLCARVESEVRFGDAGWLHVSGEDSRKSKAPFHRIRLRVRSTEKEIDFESLCGRFRAALNRISLEGLAEQLGLSLGSLERLHIGWASTNALRVANTECRESGAWTFPMSEADGRICGTRLRTKRGFKYAVAGSRQGLFVPSGLDARERLLVAEGLTDTAALLDLGFHAVGIPSCNTGFKQVKELILKFKIMRVVVVADADDVGIRGAHQLAMSLRIYCANVRVLIPPRGAKDIRQWINEGAIKSGITAAIHAAKTLGLKFESHEIGRGG